MEQQKMMVLMAGQRFLNENTPATIEAQLNEYVIGQQELVRAVADFVYYYVMRLEIRREIRRESPIRT